MKAKLLLFLLGALFGFLVAALFQPLLRPLVTEAVRGEDDVTEGRVAGKRLQGERLLLTVDATEGTVLATFTQRVAEIDLLVEEGDLLKLGVARYEPFVEDPPILSVRKQEMPSAGDGRGEGLEEPSPERPATGIIPGDDEPPASREQAGDPDGAMDEAEPSADSPGQDRAPPPPEPDRPEGPPPGPG